jgi:hypothetical protein
MDEEPNGKQSESQKGIREVEVEEREDSVEEKQEGIK